MHDFNVVHLKSFFFEMRIQKQLDIAKLVRMGWVLQTTVLFELNIHSLWFYQIGWFLAPMHWDNWVNCTMSKENGTVVILNIFVYFLQTRDSRVGSISVSRFGEPSKCYVCTKKMGVGHTGKTGFDCQSGTRFPVYIVQKIDKLKIVTPLTLKYDTNLI